METNVSTGGIYRLCHGIMNLIYLNLLWILFSVLGLIVFGLFPSTIAMFVVIRKKLRGEEDIPIFKTFWHYYRQEFLKANLMGLVMFMVGYLLYIDVQYFQSLSGLIPLLFYFIFLSLLIVYVITLIYSFTVFVHFDLSIFGVIKTALFISLTRPIASITLGLWGAVVYYIIVLIPGLLPLFSVSLLGLGWMFISLKVFTQMQSKLG
jgi:uncharacterized membrane protein YesL